MVPLNSEPVLDKLSPEELIAKGKREMLCSQISNAVECFQMACQLLAEKNGDLHDDLATPNLLYGTALLELSRSENNILGESMEKRAESMDSPEDSGDDEGDRERNIKGELKQANAEKGVGVNEVGDVGTSSVEKSTASGEATFSPPEGSEDLGDEDISTLQLAWEVVEVARKLFLRHDDAEHQLRASDCLEKLAEIGQEIGNHQQAVSDLLECLKIRLIHAPNNDRLIAETHFQLAVSYSQVGNVISSDASFVDALRRLEGCKLKLELQLSAINGEGEGDGSKINQLEMQIREVVGLIGEVSERRKEGSQSIQSVEEPQATPVHKDVPIGDISHLIKKKRRISGENAQQVPEKSADGR
ncbi:egf domain protein [Echinococcus multilocularis]|uniref:Egf domain protein n=1 Tax=Echinococcus multilocularis TaxID=6211 RepID=A0A068XXK0_ECHMU|nr:egf domain protein [Echinococcus multilocularis]